MKLLRVRDPKQSTTNTNKRNERKRSYPPPSNQRRASDTRDQGGQSQDIFPFVQSTVRKNGSMTSHGGDVAVTSQMTSLSRQPWTQRNGERAIPPLVRVRSDDGVLLTNQTLKPEFTYPVAMQIPQQQQGTMVQPACPDNRPSLQRFAQPITSPRPTLDAARRDTHNDVTVVRPFVPLQDKPTHTEPPRAREMQTSTPKVTKRAGHHVSPYVTEQSHVVSRPSVTLATPEEHLLLQETPRVPTEAEPHLSKRRCLEDQSSVTKLENFNHDRFYHVIMEAVKREILSAAEKLAVQTAQAVVRQIAEGNADVNVTRLRHLAEESFVDSDRLIGNKKFSLLNGHNGPDVTMESYSLAEKQTLDSRLVMDLDPNAVEDATHNAKHQESIASNSPGCSLSPPSVHDEQTEALSLVTSRPPPLMVATQRPTPPRIQDSPVNLSHRHHSDDDVMLSRRPDYDATAPFPISHSSKYSAGGDGRRHHSDVSNMVSDAVEMCYRQQVAPRRMDEEFPSNRLHEREHGREDLNPGSTTQQPSAIQEALTPLHLKKAKLMFFYSRYPSTNTLKRIFSDVKFTRATTSQLIKWFSNFREFFYIQVEKFARQALSDGIIEPNQLQVSRDSEVYRVLNLHYNKNEDFVVPPEFDNAIHRSLQEFFVAIQRGKDRESSWKKSIYKVICKFDQPVPDAFKSPHFPP